MRPPPPPIDWELETVHDPGSALAWGYALYAPALVVVVLLVIALVKA